MSQGFQNSLKMEEIGEAHGNPVYRLLEPLVYIDSQGRTFKIPAGFICDLDSMPQRIPLISLLLSDRPIHRAATLHDYCYRKDCDPKVSREEADGLFLEAMLSTGLSKVFAYPFFWGVRAFGTASYGILSVTAELFNLLTARGKK